MYIQKWEKNITDLMSFIYRIVKPRSNIKGSFIAILKNLLSIMYITSNHIEQSSGDIRLCKFGQQYRLVGFIKGFETIQLNCNDPVISAKCRSHKLCERNQICENWSAFHTAMLFTNYKLTKVILYMNRIFSKILEIVWIMEKK